MSDFWSEISGATFDNEASVETRLISPLLKALGYENSDISPKHRVIFQEGKAGRPYEADFVVFYGETHNRQTSLIVVEAKTPGESFDNAKTQAESYVANVRAPIYILSDGARFSVWQLQLTQESECVIDVQVASLPAHRGRIESLLSKEARRIRCTFQRPDQRWEND
jgi:predicted type IV restriction endonuclease